MTKKILIILIMSLISLLSINSQEVKDIDHDKQIWNKLTEQEKWESYMIAHNSYIRLKRIYDRKEDSIKILLDDLENTDKLLKNRWYPKYGFNLNILCGIDQYLKIDVYTNLLFKRYFLNGRVYLNIGAGVKIYDSLGGSLVLGLGFNL